MSLPYISKDFVHVMLLLLNFLALSQSQLFITGEPFLAWSNISSKGQEPAHWVTTTTYENLQIVRSQLFTDLLIFVHIHFNLKIFWFFSI